ncbi:unnamed protein product [Lepidochelys kempii]
MCRGSSGEASTEIRALLCQIRPRSGPRRAGRCTDPDRDRGPVVPGAAQTQKLSPYPLSLALPLRTSTRAAHPAGNHPTPLSLLSAPFSAPGTQAGCGREPWGGGRSHETFIWIPTFYLD